MESKPFVVRTLAATFHLTVTLITPENCFCCLIHYSLYACEVRLRGWKSSYPSTGLCSSRQCVPPPKCQAPSAHVCWWHCRTQKRQWREESPTKLCWKSWSGASEMIYSSQVKNRRSGNTEMTSEALTLHRWIWGRVEPILKWLCFSSFQNKSSGYPACSYLKTDTMYWQNLTHDLLKQAISSLTFHISCHSPLYMTTNAKKQTTGVDTFSIFPGFSTNQTLEEGAECMFAPAGGNSPHISV